MKICSSFLPLSVQQHTSADISSALVSVRKLPRVHPGNHSRKLALKILHKSRLASQCDLLPGRYHQEWEHR